MLAAPLWLALRAAAPAQPELVSMFPFGGQQGTSFKATIRGRLLDGATAIWFDCEHLSATITGVQPDPDCIGRFQCRVEKEERLFGADSTAIDGSEGGPGRRCGDALHAHSHAGWYLQRHPSSRSHRDCPPELAVNHGEPAAAQTISAVPVVISGKLTGGGELDYYAFEARQGETFRFDGLSSGTGLDPSLTLFEPGGSWFRQDRLTELAFNDDEVQYPGLPAHARITYKFAKTGRYLIRVSGFLGEGRPDHLYQLAIRRGSDGPLEVDAMRPAHLPATVLGSFLA